jgi:signal transduction histidine kinase
MKEQRGPPFRNLPLFWKVLVPFLTLMVLVGLFGVFLIARDLSSRAQATLDQDLSRRSLDARAALRDRELYLLESANFAANVEGMAAAITAGDNAAIGRLLQSVLALKTDLSLLAATDPAGWGLVEFTRAAAGEAASFGKGSNWADYPFVVQALGDREGKKSSGFLTVNGRTMLAITAPVCSVSEGCVAEGAAIVAIAVDELAAAVTGTPTPPDERAASSQTGVAIYDLEGRLLARAGLAPPDEQLAADAAPGGVPSRRTEHAGSTEIAALYAPFEVQGTRVGTLAASVPTAPAFSTVRGAGTRLALIVLVAMAGIVALGALLSRSILAQVKPLVDTNRALGQGDLSARAPVFGTDELGELARGVNQMAEQLQASYETLELRVEQRTEEVQRLLRDRTEFFAGLSHELRTPLAIILLQAQMLSATPGSRAARSEATETIKVSAAELLKLVNDILDLARAEAGSIDVELASVRLPDLFRDLEPMLVRLGAASGVEVDVTLPKRIPAVAADRARLREVIVNLVDNAIKYTPAGGRIEITAAADGGEVRVSVADTGVGIPPEVGDRVFEPFYRVTGTRPQRDQASSGLGLALTRRWVEAQRGTISWSPNPAGGTVFAFTLPVARSRPGRRGHVPTEANGHGDSDPAAMPTPLTK